LLDDEALIKAQENQERVLRDDWQEPIKGMSVVLPYFESVIV